MTASKTGFSLGSLLMLMVAISSACSSNRESRNQALFAEVRNPSEDQIERRIQSERTCRQMGMELPPGQQSLLTRADEEVTIRSKDEVVDRALALCYVALKSERTSPRDLDFFNGKFNAVAKLTHAERQMVLTSSSAGLSAATWRYESLHVLLWALGYVDSLAFPSTACHAGDDVLKIVPLSEGEFRQKASVRSRKEILDQADLVMRLQWAINRSRIENERVSPTVNEKVVAERYFALNWLIRHPDKDWDEIVSEL